MSVPAPRFECFDRDPRAVLSDCGRFRYRIECDVRLEGTTILFAGINPSRAETGVHDHTTRKWCEFTRRAGGRRWVAINPFAYRATDVADLVAESQRGGAPAVTGPLNALHVDAAIAEADAIVPCWGSLTKIPAGMRVAVWALRRKLLDAGKPVMVFGLTKDREPKHPLMLAYSTPLVPWT